MSGFTIVELLIVIVVIAILAAITIVAYNGIQVRAQNTERQTDIATIQKALELFYVEKGYYPTPDQIMSASFRTANLNASPANYVAPGPANSISYCWPNNPNQYCYVSRANGVAPDCNTEGTCTSYALSYMREGDSGYTTILSSSWPN